MIVVANLGFTDGCFEVNTWVDAENVSPHVLDRFIERNGLEDWTREDSLELLLAERKEALCCA